MKLNLSGWYYGLIGLEKLVIDLSRPQVRRRATKSDLEAYYAECVRKISLHPEYFADESAFRKAIEEVSGTEKAKLVAKESNHVPFWDMKAQRGEIDMLLNLGSALSPSKYFYAARIHTFWPLYEGSVFAQLVDGSELGIVSGAEAGQTLIEVPNDRSPAETKVSTMHETLHHILLRYQILSGRLMLQPEPSDKSVAKRDLRFAEYLTEERVIEHLTDILLEDDKDALLERRWVRYTDRVMWWKLPAQVAVYATTGVLVGLSIANPVLTPLVFAPGAISRISYALYKHAKSEELTMPIQRIELKI